MVRRRPFTCEHIIPSGPFAAHGIGFTPGVLHVLINAHTEPRRTRSICWRRPKFSLCSLCLREKMRWFLPLLLDFEKRVVSPKCKRRGRGMVATPPLKFDLFKDKAQILAISRLSSHKEAACHPKRGSLCGVIACLFESGYARLKKTKSTGGAAAWSQPLPARAKAWRASEALLAALPPYVLTRPRSRSSSRMAGAISQRSPTMP